MSTKGFTLIELIVVLTIALILMSGATISYNRFNEEKKLNQEATKLVETLKLAQIKARTGELGSSACPDLTGYEVKIQSSQHIISLCCSNSCGSQMNVTTLSQNMTIDSGYPIVAYRLNSGTQSNGFTELFQVAQDGTLGQSLPIETTIIKVKHTVLNQCINIKMNSVGTVTMTGRYTNGC